MSCRCPDFPLWITLTRATLALTWLGAGEALAWAASPWLGGAYALYVVGVFGAVIATGCRRCVYHGRRCDSGLSLLTTRLFSPLHDHATFTRVAPRFVLPLVGVALVPLGAAGWVLWGGSSPLVLSLLVLWFLAAGGLGVTNLTLACPRCAMAAYCPLGRRVSKAMRAMPPTFRCSTGSQRGHHSASPKGS